MTEYNGGPYRSPAPPLESPQGSKKPHGWLKMAALWLLSGLVGVGAVASWNAYDASMSCLSACREPGGEVVESSSTDSVRCICINDGVITRYDRQWNVVSGIRNE